MLKLEGLSLLEASLIILSRRRILKHSLSQLSLNSPHLEAEFSSFRTELKLNDRAENPVVLLRHEYRAMDKSHDSHPILSECDIMRLRGSGFTEP
jgi:hypothetical protein